MEQLHLRLHDAWRVAAKSGLLLQEFRAGAADPAGRWAVGDLVRYGVGWDPTRLETRFEAFHITTSAPIDSAPVVRPLGRDGFRCQLNPYRSLRPGRLGLSSASGRDPADCHFFCRDRSSPLSLLARPVLARVRLGGCTWNAYPNAAPLHKDGHYLWVPAGRGGEDASLPHIPQRLEPRHLADLTELARRLGDRGFLLFFNGVGAGASVDHLHIQMLSRPVPFAIERADTRSHGEQSILADFPARGFVFELDRDPERAALGRWVGRFQAEGIPMNLILGGPRAYLIPRVSGTESVVELPGGFIASIELAGEVILGDARTFRDLDEATLGAILARCTRDPLGLIDDLR